jgi:two-component system, cell cycle response regulator DivK
MSQMNEAPATILVAEDDDDNRLVMKMLLELRGYRVLVATNGVEALEVAAREHPDLILMDLRMPQLNGLAATRQLRQHADAQLRRVPIIALSAYDPAQHRNVALAAGCNEYATKPINYELLEQLIKELLRSAQTGSVRDPQRPRVNGLIM